MFKKIMSGCHVCFFLLLAQHARYLSEILSKTIMFFCRSLKVQEESEGYLLGLLVLKF